MADLRQKVQRGKKALEILEDETMAAAFAALEDRYTNDWKTSKIDDVVKRDRAYANMSVLQDFKDQLQSFVDSAKIASKQLERDKLI
jgi:hypothetical protein